MIVDSHFHILSMAGRNIRPDLEDVLGIDIGTEPDDYAEREPLLPQSGSIFASAGAGPWCIPSLASSPEQTAMRIKQNIIEWQLDAVGECGEDYYHDYGSREMQRELFYLQSEIANELKLPLIIHSRNAEKEMEEYLASRSMAERAIFHCFSYDERLARKALDKGCFISFAGNITYKGNDNLRRAAAMIPDDRLLVETDSPYLSPIPLRPRPSVPEFTEITLGFIADIRGTDKELLKEKTADNLRKVLARDKSVRKTGLASKR